MNIIEILKPTKEKAYLMICFIIFSYLLSFINAGIMSFIIKSNMAEEMDSERIFLFHAVPAILVLTQFYFFACIAIHFKNKI